MNQLCTEYDLCRFSRYVEFGYFDECWRWKGATSVAINCPSYRWGVFHFRGKSQKASRVVWQIHRWDIPDQMQVLHICDNSLCVNPGHLYLGTPADNVEDMDRKGRRRSSPVVGINHWNSKLTPEQVERARNHIGPARLLAVEFGVSPEQINNIRRRTQRKEG